MPTYRTRTKNSTGRKRAKRKYPKRLPRDPRKLFRWAASGSNKDYEKLRELARKARHSLPTHIDGVAFERLMHVDRLRLIEEIQQAEQHDVSAGAFLDGLNWLLDKIPWGNWLWPVGAAQSSINSLKGDGLNEVDEQYARLVGATYGTVSERPYVIDHWKRQVQFDSDYISVFDNPDGHRVICVRGTQGTGTDIGEDILVGLSGRSTNLLHREMLDIIAATPPGVVIDLAAHSLGTSLALESYSDKAVYNAIHETYLYSPAYSPFLRGSTDAFERDSSVRYFINVHDLVSMGGVGHKSPSNVVYRSSGGPLSSHKIAQWQGSSAYQEPIYHAPPETKLHAHKAVFGKVKHDETDDAVADVVGEDTGDSAGAQGDSEQVGEYDFGDVPEFNYAAL